LQSCGGGFPGNPQTNPRWGIKLLEFRGPCGGVERERNQPVDGSSASV